MDPPNTTVDKIFIQTWAPQYDLSGVGDNYSEYDILLKEVSKEIGQGSITKSTFVKLLKWKSPRLLGIVPLDRYNEYNDKIKEAIAAADNEKLQLLDELYGVGVPVASTILHFIYPNKFPIMDVRVTEALVNFGYLDVKARSPNNYFVYQKTLLLIVQNTGCSMREIDKALFAYHKQIIKPKKRNTRPRGCFS